MQEGASDGRVVGGNVGAIEDVMGADEGEKVGAFDGKLDGVTVGENVGTLDGAEVAVTGAMDGVVVG